MAQMVFNMVQTRMPVERLPGIKDYFVFNWFGQVWNLRPKSPELAGAWSLDLELEPDLEPDRAIKNWRFSAIKNWRNHNQTLKVEVGVSHKKLDLEP